MPAPDSKSKAKLTHINELLSYRLSVIGNLISHTLAARFAPVTDLSLLEWRAITLLNSYGPLTVKELARHAALDFGYTSRLVTRLNARGLVSKNSGSDARSVDLSLTTAGHALHKRLWNIAMECNSQLLELLKPADRAVLLNSLDILEAASQSALRD